MKILLVDDHTLVRKGMAQLLMSVMPEVEVTEAGEADEAVRHLKRSTFDVALVDIRMPGRGGLELLQEMRRDWPKLPVIIVTNYDNPEYVKAAMAQGAAGYLLKDATPGDLSQAITVAISGAGNVMSARAVRNLFEESATGNGHADRSGQRSQEAGLTRRETDILELLAVGHSNREISRRLFLSEKTVKAHLASVFRKLGVTNRTQAAMIGVSMGMGPMGAMARFRGPDFQEPVAAV
ncbi:MAG TPA: response regulator transcription factor [Actinomycetota bacterium]|nr:response regulator transcription factor [Actinomycetota bacterium]